jgi:hypothetical protein
MRSCGFPFGIEFLSVWEIISHCWIVHYSHISGEWANRTLLTDHDLHHILSVPPRDIPSTGRVMDSGATAHTHLTLRSWTTTTAADAALSPVLSNHYFFLVTSVCIRVSPQTCTMAHRAPTCFSCLVHDSTDDEQRGKSV